MDYQKLMEFTVLAEQRAEKQLKRRIQEGCPISGPYTNVFELTRRIRAL